MSDCLLTNLFVWLPFRDKTKYSMQKKKQPTNNKNKATLFLGYLWAKYYSSTSFLMFQITLNSTEAVTTWNREVGGGEGDGEVVRRFGGIEGRVISL